MSPPRRTFLKTAAAGAIGLGAVPNLLAACASGTRSAAGGGDAKPAPKRILILGGTGFIGPHQVRYAVARGHKVTIFNRGKTNPGLFGAEVEKLEGDRNGKLDALKGREWDVVIDNPATLPRWVRDSAQLLKDSAKQYIFISTISVYAANDTPNANESAAVLPPVPDSVTTENPRQYSGQYQAKAEKEAERAVPGHATVIRPGLIVGPGDYSDRFTYWPVRIEKGGEVLAPGDGSDPVQIIDARDLAEFTIRCAENGTVGTYNATGPKDRFTMKQMLDGIKRETKSDARFTWVDADFLEQQKVSAWSDMPVWVPAKGDSAGFASRDISRAVASGLTFRPFSATVRDTLAFYHAEPPERQEKLRAGLKPEREREVLAAWHARAASK